MPPVEGKKSRWLASAVVSRRACLPTIQLYAQCSRAEGTTALDSVRCPLLARAYKLCFGRQQQSLGDSRMLKLVLSNGDQPRLHRCLSKTACVQDL